MKRQTGKIMGDEKLIVAIASAIAAYIEAEELPLPLTPRGKSKAEVSRWQVSRRQDLMKTRMMPARKGKTK